MTAFDLPSVRHGEPTTDDPDHDNYVSGRASVADRVIVELETITARWRETAEKMRPVLHGDSGEHWDRDEEEADVVAEFITGLADELERAFGITQEGSQ